MRTQIIVAMAALTLDVDQSATSRVNTDSDLTIHETATMVAPDGALKRSSKLPVTHFACPSRSPSGVPRSYIVRAPGDWTFCRRMFPMSIIIDADNVTLRGLRLVNCRDEAIIINKNRSNVKITDGFFSGCGAPYQERKTAHYSSTLIHILGYSSLIVENSTFKDIQSFQILRIDGNHNSIKFVRNLILNTSYRVVAVATGSVKNQILIDGNNINRVGALASATGVGATAIYNDGSGPQTFSRVSNNKIKDTVENGIEGNWGQVIANHVSGAGMLLSSNGSRFSTPSRAAISSRGPSVITGNILIGNYRGINVYAPTGTMGPIAIYNNVISKSPGCAIFIREIPSSKNIMVNRHSLFNPKNSRIDFCQ